MRDVLAQMAGSDIERWLLDPMLDLAGLLKEQTAWTWHHSGRVARYAVAFGKAVGLDTRNILALQCAALLHDVGKIAVPPELLDKTSKLSKDEWYTITKHSMASSIMLKGQQMPARAVAIAQSHHEWFNGKGYPLGLEGEAIPLGARILSLADAYDAMSSDRPYRAALKPAEIAQQLLKGAGTQFDPALVRALMPLIANDLDIALPVRSLRIVTDDLTLVQALWFAAYPLGWELDVWPRAWAEQCPQELLAHDFVTNDRNVDLTIVDGRSARRAPDNLAETLTERSLWIDPIEQQPNAVFRPLNLTDLLPYLDVDVELTWHKNAEIAPVRVLIADPFQLFRQALRQCLNEHPHVQVVGEAKSPEDYRRAQASVGYDLAIVASDFLEGTQSPVPQRLEGELLNNVEPQDGRNKPTVVLVADEDMDAVFLKSGTTTTGDEIRRTFIHRGAPVEMLLDAISQLLLEDGNLVVNGEANGQPLAPGNGAPF